MDGLKPYPLATRRLIFSDMSISLVGRVSCGEWRGRSEGVMRGECHSEGLTEADAQSSFSELLYMKLLDAFHAWNGMEY